MSSSAEALPDEIQAMSFEQAMAALEEVVARLEGGEVGLEESIEMYARGDLLRQHCESKLKAAEERIEKIVVGGDGAATGTAPFENQ